MSRAFYLDFNGTIDDVLIFNRSLSVEQVKALYESKTYILASGETTYEDNWSACITPNDGTADGSEICSDNLTIESSNVTVTLISPANNSITKSNRNIANKTTVFKCNVTNNVNLVNISLYHNNTGTWQLNTTNNISGTFNRALFTISDLTENDFIWNCYACSSESVCEFAPANYTLTVDNTPADIIPLPQVYTINTSNNFTINNSWQIVYDPSLQYINNTVNLLNDTINETLNLSLNRTTDAEFIGNYTNIVNHNSSNIFLFYYNDSLIIDYFSSENSQIFNYSYHIGNNGFNQGYLLFTYNDNIFVLGNSSQGVYYGMQSLRQVFEDWSTSIYEFDIKDWPYLEHRIYFRIRYNYIANPNPGLSILENVSKYKMNSVHFDLWNITSNMDSLFEPYLNYSLKNFIKPILGVSWTDMDLDLERGIEGIYVSNESFVFNASDIAVASNPESNLFLNLDFENGDIGNMPNNWSASQNSSENGEWLLTNQESYSGSKCVYLTRNSSSGSSQPQIFQDENISAGGAHYLAKFKVKTNNTSYSSSTYYYRFSFWSIDNNSVWILGNVNDYTPTDDGEWHNVTVHIAQHSNASRLRLSVFPTNVYGTVYVDDIEVIRMNAEMANVLLEDEHIFTVTNQLGNVVYTKNTDYTVNKTGSNMTDRASIQTFTNNVSIERIPSGKIAENETVLISYDYIFEQDTSTYHNANAFVNYTFDAVKSHLQNISNKLVDRGFSLNEFDVFFPLDEIMGFNMDSRSIAENKANYIAMTNIFNKYYAVAKEVFPDSTVFAWGDMLDYYANGGDEDYQNPYAGKLGYTYPASYLINKSIVVIPWHYTNNDSNKIIRESTTFFNNLNITVAGGTGANENNIKYWSFMLNNSTGNYFYGHSIWETEPAKEAAKYFGEYSWKPYGGEIIDVTSGNEFELCNNLDDDGDGSIDEDYNLSTNINHCGSCGNICYYSNALSLCTNGNCQFGNCFDDYYNIDNSSSNGCEYYCVISNSGTEISDEIDNDCDGSIDEGIVSEEPSEGGGGSPGIPLICSIGAIKCTNSLHYKECLDYGTTNKWSETKDVPAGYKCEFGEIVELEEEEIVKEAVEVIEVPEEMFEKVEKELPKEVKKPILPWILLGLGLVMFGLGVVIFVVGIILWLKKKGKLGIFVVLALVVFIFGFFALEEGGITGMVTFTLPVEVENITTLPINESIEEESVEELVEKVIVPEVPEGEASGTQGSEASGVPEIRKGFLSTPEALPPSESVIEEPIELSDDNISEIISTTGIISIMANPNITFVPPTDSDGATVNRNHTFVNVSVGDADDEDLTAFINWDNSLVGWWRLNENDGSTAEDFSGNENNGTLTGFDWTSASNWTTGKFGSGLLFDGGDDYVQIADSTINSPTSEVTVSVWINDNTPTRNTGIVWKHSYNYLIYSDSTKVYFAVYNGSGSSSVSSFSVDDYSSGWNNIVGVFNGTNSLIYLNSQLTGDTGNTILGGIRDNSGDLYIGKRGDNAEDVYFNGTIDDVLIFNRFLSEEEINASYNASKYRLFQNFTNLTDKTYNYTAYVQDQNGNVNQTETRSITIDVSSPVITVNSPLNVNYTSVPSLSVTFDHAVNKSWYSVNGGGNTTLCSDCSSASSIIFHEYENTTDVSGWWHFNNNSGNTTLDESSNGNTGTCYNMAVNNTSCSWIEGKFGSGIEFDGENDYVSIADSSSNSLTNELTISIWIKDNTPTRNTGIVWKHSYNYLIYSDSTKVYFAVYNGSGSSSVSSFSVDDYSSGWNHIVAVFNGTNSLIYLNSQLAGNAGNTILGGIRDSAGDLFIGKRGDNVEDVYFNGTIDEVRILNKSLTATEVMEEYKLSKEDHNITVYANNSFSLLSNITKIFTILTVNDCFNLSGDTYGDWNNTLDITCSDMEIIRHGNTLIHNGGNLILQNTTFRIISVNGTGEAYSLKGENGDITINNSEISSWNPDINKPEPATDMDKITRDTAQINLTRSYIEINGGNINITHSNVSYLGNSTTFPGLYLKNVNDSTIYNNTFSYNFDGICLTNSHHSNISSNAQIINNVQTGIHIAGKSNHTFIEKNNVTNHSWYGIWISRSFNTTLSENNVFNNDWADLWIRSASYTSAIYESVEQVLVVNNTLGTSDRGIVAMGAENVLIENNTIINMTYSRDAYNLGIGTRHSTNIIIINNNLTQIGSFGILLQNSTNITVSKNYIDLCPLSEMNNTRNDDQNDPPTGIYISPMQKRSCPFSCTGYGDIHPWISYNITLENNTFGPNVQVLLRDTGTENLTHDLSSSNYWYIAYQLLNWTDKDEYYISVNYSNLTNWCGVSSCAVAGENTILWEEFYVNMSFSNTNFSKIIARTKLNFSNSETYFPEPFRLYSPKWLLFNGSETEDQLVYINYTYMLFDNNSVWYATVPITIDPHNDSEINVTVNQYNSTIINITAINTTVSQTMNITIENSTFNITYGEWYKITKDGTQAATAQANSNNNITFVNIAVGSDYIIEGTTAPVSVTVPGGGGGSSGVPLICSIGAIKCINSLHYQECLDYGTTNKWSETKDVPAGYKCEFGEIVELEEAVLEEVVEVVEEIGEEKILKEPEEELPVKVSVWKTLSSKIKKVTSTLAGRIGESMKSVSKWFSQVWKGFKQSLIKMGLWLVPIITGIVVISVVLYQLRKRSRRVAKKKPHKKAAKALTKFILNCRKKKIPKKMIKKLLREKGWPKEIINRYLKELF